MEPASYKILVIDISGHALLAVDGLSGEILAELPYDPDFTPTGIALTADYKKAYLPAVNQQSEQGGLWAVNLDALKIYRLPLELPPPARFILAPDDSKAYLVTPDSVFYQVNITSLEQNCWGQSAAKSLCSGLTAGPERIYSVWEHDAGGTLLVLDNQGIFQYDWNFPGTPTNIARDRHGRVYIPFTSNLFAGEGVIIIDETNSGQPYNIITTQCPLHKKNLKTYPCYVALSPDEETAYVVNEDSASVTVIDAAEKNIAGWIPVGRSISCLHILPSGKFALAASHMFGDLAMIDLVNGKLLSFTQTQRELSGYMAVVPAV
ncbi:Hypothetical protein LUCI_0474 [Lucifera butyrica]|uniref:Uncharacterized protein n=1 Tax=Lucifera butyrica TaxID=1351585 RepID=A0A498R362_9FIRM|nr:hypothetical protein [Lucifera butyrica]VBB05267.1 Hypothetical protein LUCI_0474 [Lucifera butyrica]